MKRLFLIFLRLLPVLFVLPLMASAAESSLTERIAQAQKHLSATENRIANKRLKLASQLHGLEREVLVLREKTTVARRLADEKTLSLSKLEERLDRWRQQNVYQQNLLHRFLQQHAPHHSAPTKPESTKRTSTKSILTERQNQAGITAPSNRIAAVLDVIEKLEDRLQPSWQNADIVLFSGEITTMPVLAIGPVTWYWDATENRAGLASVHDVAQNLLHADLLLSGRDSNAIALLREQSQGHIVFDPTLTRALARQQNSESLLQHIMKGGLWAVPIMLFALFALSICLLKASQLWRLPKLVRFTPTALRNAVADSASPLEVSVSGMQKTLLDIARSNSSPRQRDDQLFVQLQDDKDWLERWIGAIAITAAVSPLLGLLGTVSGMIETFKMMTLFGSGDPEVVSGGIAQALVTTELGLVVAIPALILNAILSRRAKTYYSELESFAILLSKADEPENDGVSEIHTIAPQASAVNKILSNDIPAVTSPVTPSSAKQGVPA